MNIAEQRQQLKNTAMNTIRGYYKEDSTFNGDPYEPHVSWCEERDEAVQYIMNQLEIDLNNT